MDDTVNLGPFYFLKRAQPVLVLETPRTRKPGEIVIIIIKTGHMWYRLTYRLTEGASMGETLE